ncbi:MAG TPA: hypothetical protein VN026_14115 [Bacteroidia bacterium]|jgi:hypothetical protein|nr:hypothetical protein [Bacteroidia bacterium]
MRYFILFIAAFICKTNFSQEVIKINFSDSCIITSCDIKKDDFRNIKWLCPAGVTKVISFVTTYKADDNVVEYTVPGNWIIALKNYDKMPIGTKIYCSQIKGNTKEGTIVNVPDIIITVK